MWSYNKPVHAGRYHVNRGDVVTDYTLEEVILTETEHGLMDADGVTVDNYNHLFKFRVWEPDMTSDRLNVIGNAE